MRLWLSLLNIRPLYIEPGSPWENGYIESVHDKFRDELLNRELLDTLYESPGSCRAVAPGVQHRAATQLARVSSAGTRGDCLAPRGQGVRSITRW